MEYRVQWTKFNLYNLRIFRHCKKKKQRLYFQYPLFQYPIIPRLPHEFRSILMSVNNRIAETENKGIIPGSNGLVKEKHNKRYDFSEPDTICGVSTLIRGFCKCVFRFALCAVSFVFIGFDLKKAWFGRGWDW